MYNFNLMDGEEVVSVFDEVLIRQEGRQKFVSIALTNKRMLFLDYINEGPAETLRVTRTTNYIRFKEVTHIINLNDIDSINKQEYYLVTLKDNISFEFDNDELYNMLIK